MKLTEKHFVISRLWRNGKVTIPTSETILKEKDHLLIISVKADVESIKVLFGEQETTDWNKEDIDWNAIDSQLISRRIVVTRNRVNGVKLGSLLSGHIALYCCCRLIPPWLSLPLLI